MYLRDRKQNKTTLVSRTNGGDPATGDSSDNASVSANGKFVQFESYATNFPGGGTYSQVLIRDTDAGKTRLVSRSNSGNPGEDDGSFMKAESNLISRDPRFSTFNSYASNLPGRQPRPTARPDVRGPNP